MYKIRNYKTFSPEQQRSLAHETSYIYTPMAHKLGLYKIKTDFEETTMKILEPSIFQFINLKLNETNDDAIKPGFTKPIYSYLIFC